MDCYSTPTANQTFILEGAGSAGAAAGESDVATSFTVKNADSGYCLQPQLERLPHFDAVAFADDNGAVSVVVLNTNDEPIDLTLRDEAAGVAVDHIVPAHAIHTYRWDASSGAAADAALVAEPSRSAAMLTASAASVQSGVGSSSAALQTVLAAAMPYAVGHAGVVGARAAVLSTEQPAQDPPPQTYEWTSHGLIVAALGLVSAFAAIVGVTAMRRARLGAPVEPTAEDDDEYVAFSNVRSRAA